MATSRDVVLGSMAVMAALGAWAAPAQAERRSFGVAEDVDLQTEGTVGFRWNSTHGRFAAWAGQAEGTFGISAHWDIAFVQGVAATDGDALHLGGTGLRVRYQPAGRGAWPVDVRADVNLMKSPRACTAYVEPRVALARDIWKLRVVGNAGMVFGVTGNAPVPVAQAIDDPIGSCGDTGDLDAGSATATWAGGVRYRLVPTFDIGVEAFGHISQPLDDDRAPTSWVGPAFSWAPRPRLYVTAAAGFGVGRMRDDVIAHVAFGLEL